MIITKKDLIKLGYSDWQSSEIIRKTKALLINRGLNYYDNKRLGIVPLKAVEEILGFSISLESPDIING